MVTLHDNGDLIFWKLAYREKWAAHNVMNHLKWKTVKGTREGLKKDPPKGLSTSSDVVPIVALFWLSRNRKALDQSVGTVLLVPSSTVWVQVWNLHGFVDQFATASELNEVTRVTCAAIDDSER
uniref:Uncharacterized protein n=1 Tax=Cacopsylla melanoneura TaxID=428564 RepID=A0A8D9EA21_9HEMI